MPVRKVVARAPLAHLSRTFAAIRSQEGVSVDRPAAVAKEVARVRETEELPHILDRRVDLTDMPFVTIDPEGSRDLDQAMYITREGNSWRVRYAIADVAAHVAPGGAIDADAWARVETVYCPDLRVGLHPPAMSEGFASLLPGQRTKAVVWDLSVADDGTAGIFGVKRAWVTSRHQYSYDELRADPPGPARELVEVLAAVGSARRGAMTRAGALSLPKPSQEVTTDGRLLHLEFRAGTGIEDDNAQISLLTGMAAARLMLEAGVGILRTIPPASEGAMARLRRQAEAIGIDWPMGVDYAQVLTEIDPLGPRGAAFLTAAVSLFRGARWDAFDVERGLAVPEQALHGALAAPYAHVTAPLRRLVDRYATEVCLAHVAGRDVPEWVREKLPDIGDVMTAGVHRGARVDRACIEAVEAAVLAPYLGREFDAVALDDDTVQLHDPAVVARCDGELEPGRRVTVRLTSAELAHGPRFERVDS